jgi:hypothetical protein
MAFVVMRSGPLAPTRVTVVQATEGRLTPAAVRHRHGRGPTQLPDRADGGRPRAVGGRRRGRHGQAGQLLAEMDPVDLDERAAALDASVARAGSAMAAADAQRRDAQAKQGTGGGQCAPLRRTGSAELHQYRRRRGRLQEQASAECDRHRGRRQPGRGTAGPAAPGGRTRRAAPAARQRAPAGACRRRRDQSRCRAGVDRGGRVRRCCA